MTRFPMRPVQAILTLAALTSLSACSVFAIKPATPAPTTPAPATQPANRPAATPPPTPATTPATAPATTPAAAPPAAPRLSQDQIEANRIKDDSTRLASLGRARRYSPVYFTLLLDGLGSSMRTAHNGVLAPEEEPGFSSVELALQKANGSGLGIAIRAIKSDEAYEYQELALLMGSRRFALDLGVATRTGFDSLNLGGGGAYDSLYIFPRVGFRSRANIGATDFSAQFRALLYVPLPSLDDALPESEFAGWSAETGLSWTWNRFPLTANLGYRIERFRAFGREIETSSMILGAGVVFGRRPRPPAAPEVAPAPAPATPPGNAQAAPPRRP
jgi:hypothetical protein